jgi:chromosomal replication initiation ATPase DnaA
MFQKTFPQIIDFIKSLYPNERPIPLHAPRFTGNEKKYVIDANEVLYQTAKFDISLDELISRVCAKFEIRVKDLVSKSRKRYLSQARAVVCYLAVDELPAP